MDLLGGYNSDSDSDSDSPSPPVPSQPAPSAAKPTVSQKPSVNLSTKISTSTSTSGSKQTSSSSRKGKRLLKLQAVLPENIWNQLSNGSLQKDSDDEESDEDAKTRTSQSKNAASQNPGDKSDLANLLQALPKSKTGTAGLGDGGGNSTTKSFLQDSDDFSNTVIGSESSSDKTSSSAAAASDTKSSFSAPLGAAFLTSTVETVRKKKSAPNTVVDIHGQSSSAAVETVEDADSDDDEADNKSAPSSASSKPAHAFVSSVSSVPRPGMKSRASGFARARMAAPTVSAARYPQHAQHQPSYPVPPGVTPYASANPAASAAPPPGAQGRAKGGAKSRKREMERMLRQGNLEGVTSDFDLEGQANVYQPPEQAQQQTYQSHGIRMAPTSQYNVGQGGMTASAKVSGKQRGKNQMNALLSNAVSLEAERSRNPLPQQKVQRANAKRKYGW